MLESLVKGFGNFKKNLVLLESTESNSKFLMQSENNGNRNSNTRGSILKHNKKCFRIKSEQPMCTLTRPTT